MLLVNASVQRSKGATLPGSVSALLANRSLFWCLDVLIPGSLGVISLVRVTARLENRKWWLVR